MELVQGAWAYHDVWSGICGVHYSVAAAAADGLGGLGGGPLSFLGRRLALVESNLKADGIKRTHTYKLGPSHILNLFILDFTFLTKR
jgi:hypothetical protein